MPRVSFPGLASTNLTVLPVILSSPAPLGTTMWLCLAQLSIPQAVVEAKAATFGFPHNVADILENLLVAVSWLHVAGHSAGGQVAGPLLLHELMLSLFGLRKLGRNDHEAQIDHEE